MSEILLENVSRSFGGFTAVDRIDLAVDTGEFLTLLGPSGCGKTTTLRMIAGLEQNSAGRILIGGQVVSDPAGRIFVAPERRQLGMVFQSYAIWPHMTVFENVAYPLRIRRRPSAEVRTRVLEALRLVEMEPYAERPAPALSGGQQQRVAIARALVFEPRGLLLDEPLSNLDARLRSQTGDEFRALQKRLRITSIYVTHDQNEAMSLSDRIVVMERGRILQVGPPEQIYREPCSAAVASFFGTPNLLVATVAGMHRGERGEILAEIRGNGFSGTCRSPRIMPEGTSVQVLLRPENVRFVPEDADGQALRWRGEVVQTMFRGTFRSFTVRTGSGDILVDSSAIDAPPLGAHVVLEAEPGAAWLLPTESN